MHHTSRTASIKPGSNAILAAAEGALPASASNTLRHDNAARAFNAGPEIPIPRTIAPPLVPAPAAPGTEGAGGAGGGLPLLSSSAQAPGGSVSVVGDEPVDAGQEEEWCTRIMLCSFGRTPILLCFSP